MPGRLPFTDALTFAGTAAQETAWAAMGVDQDYDVTEVAVMPDAGSMSGQIQALIATFSGGGGSSFSGGKPQSGYIAHSAGLNVPTQFGGVRETLLTSALNANLLVTIWGGAINNRFNPRTVPIYRDEYLVIVAFNTKAGGADGVARALTFQVNGVPARKVA